MKKVFLLLLILIGNSSVYSQLKKPTVTPKSPVLPSRPLVTKPPAESSPAVSEAKAPVNTFQLPGQNCFNTLFNNAATGSNLMNSYLLNYLCVMAYPQYIRYTFDPVLPETNPVIVHLQFAAEDFEKTFEAKTFHLFTNLGREDSEKEVTYEFVHKCVPIGFDPEVMLISTPTTVFVIFRGTDRVSCSTTETGYDWWEWTRTDFDFGKMPTGINGISGKVHSGFWKCLNVGVGAQEAVFGLNENNFINMLSDKVKAYSNNGAKKIWVAGHSLGGAEAQIFAVYLKAKHNLKIQGLHLFSSAHPGDKEFVAQLNSIVGKQNIQRFEFSDDPVPHGGPQLPPPIDYGRAGIRNFIRDLNSPIKAVKEDNGLYDLTFFLNGAANALAGATTFSYAVGGCFCFHHPTFTLDCLRRAVIKSNASLSSKLPSSVPLPLNGDNCNPIELNLAAHFTRDAALAGLATSASQAIQKITYATSVLVNNIHGVDDLPAGSYRIRNYAFFNQPSNYVNKTNNCAQAGSDACRLNLSSSNNSGQVFDVLHDAAGYTFSIGGQRMEVDVDQKGDEGGRIWMKNKFDPDLNRNQHWLLFPIPGHEKTFLVYNATSFKCLSVDARCNTNSSSLCDLFQNDAIDNDPSQVWVFEPVNNAFNDNVTQGVYCIKSALKPNKCLSVNMNENKKPNGSCRRLELWDKLNPIPVNERFIIEDDQPSGAYKIRTMADNINQIIDADLGGIIGSGDRVNGASVNVCTDGNPDFDRHLWFIDLQSDGTCFIKLKKDPTYVLDVADAQNNGSLFFTFRKNTNDISQKWILERVLN